MADISRLSRLVAGVNRGVDLQVNSLVMQSLKLTDDGGTTSSALTKTILDNLTALQNGSDFATGVNAHTHDGRYRTETELSSNANAQGASLIGIEDSALQYTATNVEGALAESLDAAQAAQLTADNHIADAAGAHAASAISNTPAGNIAATDMQAAVNELDSEKAASADLASNANGQGASLIGIEDSALQYTATTVEGALTESLDAAQAAQASIDAHKDGGVSKHDATEVDYERLDGSKIDIQAISDDVESALSDLDDNKLGIARAGSAANGDGASLIGVEDAAANFVGTNVESVLAELQSNISSSTSGINMKDAVELASTANLTLSGEQTIDGILTSASRILVKDQTVAADNGIYVTAAGAWSRAADFDGNPTGEVKGGNLVYVQTGTANSNTQFILQGNADNKVVGTDPLNFSIFSRAEAVVDGDGILKTGLTLSVVAANIAGAGLEDDGANNLRIASTAAGAGLALAAGVLSVNAGGGLEVSGDQVQLAASVAGSGINLTAGVLSVDLTPFSTTNLSEGSNLYFTEARVRASVLTGFVSGAGAVSAADSVLSAIQKLDGNANAAQADAATAQSTADNHIADAVGAHAASAISYSNGSSGLTATDAQAAIDEIEGRVDTLEAADATPSSLDEQMVADESFAAGALSAVRMAKPAAAETTGRVRKADNNAASSDNFYVIGLAIPVALVSAGGNLDVVKAGPITATAHGFTVGEPIFLGSGGGLTNTAPSTANLAALKVGIARDANTIEVQIGSAVIN